MKKDSLLFSLDRVGNDYSTEGKLTFSEFTDTALLDELLSVCSMLGLITLLLRI